MSISFSCSTQAPLRRSLVALSFSLSMLMLSAPALADDDIRLGKTLLLGVGDYPATIPMVICRPVKSIMVKARRDLTLDRVKVTYGKDRSKTLYFNRELGRDQESGWKSLGSRLCVKKIEVYGYSSGSKAGVEVYGRK